MTPDTSNIVDERLIAQIREGSESAFSKLYSVYFSYLCSVAYCYLQDEDAVYEVVDNVFVNVWNRRASIKYPIIYYLLRSVRNGCLNYIRSERSKRELLSEHKKNILEFQEYYIMSTPMPLQYVQTNEVEKEIRAEISKLPPKCRQIVEQFIYARKDIDAIAKEMNLSESTVRVQIKNATDRLKVALKYFLVSSAIFMLK